MFYWSFAKQKALAVGCYSQTFATALFEKAIEMFYLFFRFVDLKFCVFTF